MLIVITRTTWDIERVINNFYKTLLETAAPQKVTIKIEAFQRKSAQHKPTT